MAVRLDADVATGMLQPLTKLSSTTLQALMESFLSRTHTHKLHKILFHFEENEGTEFSASASKNSDEYSQHAP
jgi:hypothetical protein